MPIKIKVKKGMGPGFEEISDKGPLNGDTDYVSFTLTNNQYSELEMLGSIVLTGRRQIKEGLMPLIVRIRARESLTPEVSEYARYFLCIPNYNYRTREGEVLLYDYDEFLSLCPIMKDVPYVL